MDQPTIPPVLLEGVKRQFGKNRRALDGVDLEVKRGEILGLVGPNGSGKTTLLKILAGFLRPTSGRALLFGSDPFRDRARVMERTRFAFAPPSLFERLSAREHLHYLGSIGVARSQRPRRAQIDEALSLVGLTGRETEPVRNFSFGMRQRLMLAQALLPLPELIVLDEPTDGLDPIAILELRETLGRLRDRHGLTILLSSHLLVEVDELVDRMLVLTEGKTLFCGTPAQLCEGTETLTIRTDHPQKALLALQAHGLSPTQRTDDRIELPADSIRLGEAMDRLREAGVELLDFHVRGLSLEEALLARLRENRASTSPPSSSSEGVSR